VARREKAKLDGKSVLTRTGKALAQFNAWKAKFSDLEALSGLTRQISEIESVLSGSRGDSE
jgi:hypothetical protein